MPAVYDPEQLKDKEQNPYDTSTSPGSVSYSSDPEGPEQSFYTPTTNSTSAQKSGRFNLFGTRRRKIIFGATGAGTIGSLVLFFTLASGPFQFIHIAQLLQQFHFTTIQNEQDDRFMKQVRFISLTSKGQVEKTRMGVLSNKFADKFEAKLNTSGLTSAYTDRFGLFDGYVIDKNNDAFKGMSDGEIKQSVKENMGIEPVKGSSIKGSSAAIKNELVLKTAGLGYRDTFKLNYEVLRQAGYNKLSAAIGARLFCSRAGCNWHALTKLTTKGKRALEAWAQKDNESKRLGQQDIPAEDVGKQPDPKDTKAANDKAAADSALKDTSNGAQDAHKNPAKFFGFKQGLGTRLAGGGAAAVGILCMVKGVNEHAGQIKQTQVILPLIRTGIEAISVGSQIQSGQDVDLSELGQLSKQLNGADSSGKTTSWDQSRSIQTNLGKTNTGVAPNTTLTTINNGEPFDFVNKIPLLGSACSTAGQVFTGVLSIAIDATGIGAVAQNIGTGVLTSVASGPVLDQIAHWLAGQAVAVDAVGADYGNNIDYGAALAANSQSISSGGRQLSKTESGQLSQLNNSKAQEQYKKQSLAYKLLNPYDANTVTSGVIDSASQSFGHNLFKLADAFTNFGHVLSVIPHYFTAPVHAAASAGYDYGFPIYGFSDQDMSNPMFENPYDNACHVVGCPDKGISGFLTNGSGAVTASGHAYINRAEKCFGVNIAPDSSGNNWNVTASDTDPNPYGDNGYGNQDCNDASKEWSRLRFFIMDTETMNSMGCYSGDSQACSDVGFENSTQAPPTSGGGDVSGYVDPLRDVNKLTPKRIDQGVDYGGSGPVYAIGNGTLVNITNSGWAVEGGPPTFMVYRLSDGPAAGKFVYVAENCIPSAKLRIGSTVNSGTVLCNMVDAPPHIEIGWADGSALGAAKAHNVWNGAVDNEQHYTAYGLNFSQLMKKLGSPPGTIQAGAQELGSLDQGWPTW